MNEQNAQEIAYRRLACKLFDKGKSATQILRQIPRSRSWLFKWKHRFADGGWAALESGSTAPKTSPQSYPPAVRQLVCRVRRRLQRAKVGLCGARAVFLELHRNRLVKVVPSLSTVNRWLRAAGFFPGAAPQGRAAYYPALQCAEGVLVASCDWLARYVEGGEKVFCFHTLEHRSHALSQTLATDKTAQTACHHLLQSFQEVGVADFLQLDNDAAFTGLGKQGRGFGRFVRLALYFGVELIFLPPGEPKRNGLVERVNGLWVSSFWNKNRFASARAVKKKSPKFLAWYDSYCPPSLDGLSVQEARGLRARKKLRPKEVERVPEQLPLTAGRVHFIRKVDSTGAIAILQERFRVSKSLTGQYVFATIDLREKHLQIAYRRSPRATAKVLKQFPYRLAEPIKPLQSQYRRRKRRVRVLQII